MNIEDAIKEFEKYNNLKIENYLRYFSDPNDYNFKEIDRYIGHDVFFDNINKWLEICNDDDEKNILLKLLTKFNYFTEKKYKIALGAVLKQLKELQVSIKETIFVTFYRENRLSGGEHIAVELKIVGEGDIDKAHIIHGDSYDSNILDECKNIVFIDDVFGSCTTLFSHFRSFIEYLESEKISIDKYNYVIASICSRKGKADKKKKDIEKQFNISLKRISYIELEKCLNISSFLASTEEEKIKRIEEKINVGCEDNCVLGFEHNQLLVSFFYDTPNNTMSVFWRNANGNKPLFLREEENNKRPSINELKIKHSQTVNKAYEYGKNTR